MRSDHAWLFLKRCDRGCMLTVMPPTTLLVARDGRRRSDRYIAVKTSRLLDRRLYGRYCRALCASTKCLGIAAEASAILRVGEQCSEQSLSLRIECRRRETSKSVGAADFAHNEKSIAAHVHD